MNRDWEIFRDSFIETVLDLRTWHTAAVVVFGIIAMGFLAGCVTYYDEPVRYGRWDPGYSHGYRYRSYDYDERRYYRRDSRVRDGSYFQTEQYGVVDEHGKGWSRCWAGGKPAWCRVD